MPPKKNANATTGARADDDVEQAGDQVGDGRGLTFDQQMALLKLKADIDVRKAQSEADNLRLQLELADRQAQAAQAQAAAYAAGQAAAAQGAAQGGQQPVHQARFDVYKASGILPVYDERDVELYLMNFEKIAEASEWPREKWALILQPKLSGKALKAVSRLSVREIGDYDSVRKAILDELELVAEVYRLKFRKCSKRESESYADYASFMSIQFDRWLNSKEVADFDQLKQLMLIEQFVDKVPQDVKEYLLDTEYNTVMDLARSVDEYAAVHKGAGQARQKQQNSFNVKQDFNDRPKASNVQSSYSNDSSFKTNEYKPKVLGQQTQYQAQYSKPLSQVSVGCFYCHGPHLKRDCPKLKRDQAATVSFVRDFCQRKELTDVNEYVVPVTVKCKVAGDVQLQCWRDTGAQISCLREGSVPVSCLTPTDNTVYVQGVTSRDAAEVPVYKVSVTSDIVNGEIEVALTPRSFGMPSEACPFLLGNDFGPKLSFEPRAQVSAVVTRRQAKLQQGQGQAGNAEPDVMVGNDQVTGIADDEASGGQSHDSETCDQGQGHDGVGQGVEPAVRVGLGDALESVHNLFDGVAAELNVGEGDELLTCDKVVQLQKQDSSLADLFDKIVGSQGEYQGYRVRDNGLLVHSVTGEADAVEQQARIVLPSKLRAKVLNLAHSVPVSGHLGIGKTRKRVMPFFYWPGMLRDIKAYCKTCDVCQRNGKSKQSERVPMVLPPIIEKPFGRISIDIVGPMPETTRGNRFVLTVVDHSTRWVEAYCMPEHKSTDVVRALLDYFARYGIVDEVLHDLGTDFTSELTRVVLKFYGVCQIQSSVMHPQTNTAVERFHSTMKSMIRALSHEHGIEWDDALPFLLFAYREVPVAEYGFSPYELVFGRYVRGPLSIVYDDWWEAGEQQASTHVVEYMLKLRDKLDVTLDIVHKQQTEAQENSKRWYDKKARAKVYKEGDLVLVFMPQSGKPLAMKYVGPYRVLKQTTPVNYLIEFPEGRKPHRVIHANLLKKYHVRTEHVGSVCLAVPLCSVSVVDAEDDGARDEPCLLSTPPPSNYVELLAEKTRHLEPIQAKQICELVEEFKCVVSDRPGLTDLYTHHIALKPGAKPVRLRPYRMAPKHQELLRLEIDKLLAEGVIEPSNSEWSSPTILVPKPDGSVRCVIDLRGVNAVIEDECYPIPRIDDLLDRVGRAQYLTKIDLSSSFHQVALDQISKQYTSFSTPFGQFQYCRLPFGLKTSPLKFSYVIDQALSDLYQICGMYIDDIIVCSATWNDHLRDLRLVLERLKRAKLTVKLNKCSFACQEVDYVGHTVGVGRMSPRLAKVKALLDSARPVDKKSLKSFLGMAGFYQRYVAHYGNLTAPLTNLLRKDKAFVWSQVEEDSFVAIKTCLCNGPVLQIADHAKPFVLMVDASLVACGAVLMQADEQDSLRPVCYFSKKFNDAQRNYTVRDREALGLVLAVRAFRVYLLSGPVLVYTDHEPLKFINSMATTNQRLLRWALELQPYQLKIKHVKGKDNVVADYLSRPCLPLGWDSAK